MSLTLQQLKALKFIVLVGPPMAGYGKFNSTFIEDELNKLGINVSTEFTAATKAIFYNPKFANTSKIGLAKQKGFPCYPYDVLYPLVQQAGAQDKDVKTWPTPNPQQPGLTHTLLKGKVVKCLAVGTSADTQAKIAPFIGPLKAYGAITTTSNKAKAQIVFYEPVDSDQYIVQHWLKLAGAGKLFMYSYDNLAALIKIKPPTLPSVPPLSEEVLKGKLVTMAGSPAGYDFSTDSLDSLFKQIGTTVSAKFSPSTKILFYNPKDVSGAKVQAAIAAGLWCYSYDSVNKFIKRDWLKKPSTPKPVSPVLSDPPQPKNWKDYVKVTPDVKIPGVNAPLSPAKPGLQFSPLADLKAQIAAAGNGNKAMYVFFDTAETSHKDGLSKAKADYYESFMPKNVHRTKIPAGANAVFVPSEMALSTYANMTVMPGCKFYLNAYLPQVFSPTDEETPKTDYLSDFVPSKAFFLHKKILFQFDATKPTELDALTEHYYNAAIALGASVTAMSNLADVFIADFSPAAEAVSYKQKVAKQFLFAGKNVFNFKTVDPLFGKSPAAPKAPDLHEPPKGINFGSLETFKIGISKGIYFLDPQAKQFKSPAAYNFYEDCLLNKGAGTVLSAVDATGILTDTGNYARLHQLFKHAPDATYYNAGFVTALYGEPNSDAPKLNDTTTAPQGISYGANGSSLMKYIAAGMGMCKIYLDPYADEFATPKALAQYQTLFKAAGATVVTTSPKLANTILTDTGDFKRLHELFAIAPQALYYNSNVVKDIETPNKPTDQKSSPYHTKPLSLELLKGTNVKLLPTAAAIDLTAKYTPLLQQYDAKGFTSQGGQQYTIALYDPKQIGNDGVQTDKFLNLATQGKLQAYSYAEFDEFAKANPPEAIPISKLPNAGQPIDFAKWPNRPPLTPALIKNAQVYLGPWNPDDPNGLTSRGIFAPWLKAYGAILQKSYYIAKIIFLNPTNGNHFIFKNYEKAIEEGNIKVYSFLELNELIKTSPPTFAPVPPLSPTVVQGAVITFAGKTKSGFSMKEAEQKLNAYGLNVKVTNTFTPKTKIVCYNPDDVKADKVAAARAAGIKTYSYDSLITFIVRTLPKSKQLTPGSPSKSPTPTPGAKYAVQPGVYAPFFYKEIKPKVETGMPPSLKSYYGSGYHSFNDPFTHGKEHSGNMRQWVEDLLLILQLANQARPKLYRGVSNSDAVEKYFKMKPGDMFVKPAFMSSSWKTKTPYSFAGWNDSYNKNKRVMLEFDATAITGKEIYDMGEDELLLRPRTRMLITDIQDLSGNRRQLYVTATNDPELAAPKKLGTASAAISSTADWKRSLKHTGSIFLMPDDDQP